MKVSLISITPNIQETIAYCARVSSKNQENENIAGLIKYCIKNKHWSIFEQGFMTVEIETSRAISAQILRHRSFTFQEFSQRYAETTGFETYKARRQDSKNRQNSIDDMSENDSQWFLYAQSRVQKFCEEQYKMALAKGIAKEQARFLLPMSTGTKLYMSGCIRSFIHYLELRTEEGTQLEHRLIAERIQGIFMHELPIISEALGWN